MDNKTAFFTELKSLLKKYNASIEFELDGDTHGVHSWMFIEVDGKQIFKLDDVALTHSDIPVELEEVPETVVKKKIVNPLTQKTVKTVVLSTEKVYIWNTVYKTYNSQCNNDLLYTSDLKNVVWLKSF
jgi:hypothetical protein